MGKYKKQHWVQKSYLKEWADPSDPKGRVWAFDINMEKWELRNPRSLFTHHYIYSRNLPDGDKNHALEISFQDLEGRFTEVRDTKLKSESSLTLEDNEFLRAFTAFMYCRNFYSLSDLEASIKSEDTGKQSLEKNLKPSIFLTQFPIIFGVLRRMEMKVLENDDKLGFITSDRPCIRIFPSGSFGNAAYKYSLLQPNVEIILPVTPKLALGFYWFEEYRNEFASVEREHGFPYLIGGAAESLTSTLWHKFLVEPFKSKFINSYLREIIVRQRLDEVNRIIWQTCKQTCIVRKKQIHSYWQEKSPSIPGYL